VWSSQGHKHINRNAHRNYQGLLFFVFMGQPLLLLLRITMKSNIHPQATCMFLEWTVFSILH